MKKHTQIHYGDIIVGIGLLISIFIFLNNVYLYGLHYDEVNRINPLFALFNPDALPNNQAIWSLKIGDISIPIVYKEYISSLATFYMFPLIFFKDSFIGLKSLYMIYHVIAIISVYIYLKKHNRVLATGVSVLMMVNPLIFPDVFFSFANFFHAIFLVLSLHFFEKFYKTQSAKSLFLGCFFICFGANVSFYTIWIIVAMFLSSLIIDFPFYKTLLKQAKIWISLFLGICFGLFNFILYNIMTGFPTVRTLLEYIFSTDEFEMDQLANTSFKESLQVTLSKLNLLLNDKLYIYAILICLMLLFWMSLFVLKITKKLSIDKHYFYPILIFAITLFCIFISPKPRFSYHWLRLSPMFEISIVLSLLLIYHIFFKDKVIIGKLLLILCFSICASWMFFQSIQKIESKRISVSDYQLSTDYRRLTDYFINHNIDNSHIMYLEWGIDAPIYLLTKGSYNDLEKDYFSYMNMDNDKLFNNHKYKFYNLTKHDLYIPIYKSKEPILHFDVIQDTFLDFLDAYNINYSIVDELFLNDIDLYKLSKDETYISKVFYSDTNLSLESIKSEDVLPVPQNLRGYLESNMSLSQNSETQELWGWVFLEDESEIIKSLFPVDVSNKPCGYIEYNQQRDDVYNEYKIPSAKNSGFIGLCTPSSIDSFLIITNKNIYKWKPFN